MVVQIIGWFCLGCGVLCFGGTWMANYKGDYELARHTEFLIPLFLIAAAICFK